MFYSLPSPAFFNIKIVHDDQRVQPLLALHKTCQSHPCYLLILILLLLLLYIFESCEGPIVLLFKMKDRGESDQCL